jgi:hypothetical protein
VFTPEAMRPLIAEVGVSQIVMGSDYPFPWNTAPVDHILATSGASDADRAAMLGDTAARLLGIQLASGPIPKLVNVRGTLKYELRNQGPLAGC